MRSNQVLNVSISNFFMIVFLSFLCFLPFKLHNGWKLWLPYLWWVYFSLVRHHVKYVLYCECEALCSAQCTLSGMTKGFHISWERCACLIHLWHIVELCWVLVSVVACTTCRCTSKGHLDSLSSEQGLSKHGDCDTHHAGKIRNEIYENFMSFMKNMPSLIWEENTELYISSFKSHKINEENIKMFTCASHSWDSTARVT